jgi:hypothetical protein
MLNMEMRRIMVSIIPSAPRLLVILNLLKQMKKLKKKIIKREARTSLFLSSKITCVMKLNQLYYTL